jgi:integrase
MPAKVALEPVFVTERNRWRVDVPGSMTPNGKRVRAHFKSRASARDYIDKISGTNPSAVAIDPRLASDADTARQRLEAAGLDLTLAEAVAELIEARAALDGCDTILAAARLLRAQHDARIASKSVKDAVAAFTAAKEGTLRDITAKSYSYSLKSLGSLHDKMLSDVTSDELTSILGEKKPTARAMHLRNLRVFWRWASKEPRGWATMATVDALEFRKEAGEGEIAILHADDVRALLAAAESVSENAAVAYALSIFAGVRQAELERMTWANVLSDHIELGASITKKGRRRLIPISPSLRAWLDAYAVTDTNSKNEPIVGPNWPEYSKACRRLAGWDVAARVLENPPKPTRGVWPANSPRHTCASVLVATGEPLETLIFQFGHSGGHDLLRRHYVGRLSKKDALAILAVGPNGSKLKLSTIAAA